MNSFSEWFCFFSEVRSFQTRWKRKTESLRFCFFACVSNEADDNLTELESQLSTALYSVQAQLGRVLVSILFAFGIVGNALLFCACVQSKLRQQSYSYFLRALVVLDSANLFVILLEVFAKVAQDSLFTGEAGCKAWEYFRQVCGTMSWWLTASLSCERFMILYHPLRGRVFCRGQHVLAVIIVLFLASLALQVRFLDFLRVTSKRHFNRYWSACSILNHRNDRIVFDSSRAIER